MGLGAYATYLQADYLLWETTSYPGRNVDNELWLHCHALTPAGNQAPHSPLLITSHGVGERIRGVKAYLPIRGKLQLSAND